jgi:hypothetical protein
MYIHDCVASMSSWLLRAAIFGLNLVELSLVKSPENGRMGKWGFMGFNLPSGYD